MALVAVAVGGAFALGGLATADADVLTPEQLDCLYGFCGQQESQPADPEEPTLYLRVNDAIARPGQRVRFFGELYPQRNGRSVYIQKRGRGGYRTVTRTVLRRGGADELDSWSTYSVRISVRRTGIYRARVLQSGNRPAVTSLSLEVTVDD
jgi:hypothetical protein